MGYCPGYPGLSGSKRRTTASTLRQMQPRRNLINGPVDPDTKGTVWDSHANFQPLRSNGLGGDSGQQPENGPDFPANSTKTVIRNSVKNDPIETEFFSLISA